VVENLQNIAVLAVTTYKNAGYSRIRITGIKKFKVSYFCLTHFANSALG